ncbi:sigma-70 family RNA polymerase sigma factor [Nocardia macrotermitis]|uniref:Uncharacterized protein n=1 Tax=Nocardia macrotermitis TaxID=2585198 RepID=A0A7K0DE70_9NOCA|nr:sigma-70 family RNA polymerase sigma factor [Nocardia macrotermitis]MQY24100.1 hypothetical protein [Nocardia macrotermitis]
MAVTEPGSGRLPESAPATSGLIVVAGERDRRPEVTARPSAFDAELDAVVGAAVRGDRQALVRVLEIVQQPVVRYCRARIGYAERGQISADDVAQEVCLAVVTALPRYQDQGRPFMAFVYGIAAHKVADARRNLARDKSYATDEVPEVACLDQGPEQRALESEETRRMNAMLATLPERAREILILRLVVGLSAEETATTVGSTAGAVRVAQHRALAKLRVLAQAEEMVR